MTRTATLTIRQHLLVFLFFALIAFLALNWLLFHLTTHVPYMRDFTDYYHFQWNYWWIKHALSNPELAVYQTDYVAFPTTSNLAYHTLTPFWFPLWLVLHPLLGYTGVFNAVILLSLILNGYFCFLLFLDEGASSEWALFGSLAYQITPMTFFAINIYWFNLVAWFWLPLTLLVWKQIARNTGTNSRALLWAVILGLAFGSMGLTDLQYLLFAAFLLVPYGVLSLALKSGWYERAKLCLLGGLAIIVGLAILWQWGPLPYLQGSDTETFFLGPPAKNSALTFPQSYFVGSDNYSQLGQYSIGLLLMPLLIFTLLANIVWKNSPHLAGRSNQRWFWLALAVPLLVLSAGASVTILGREITLPYQTLHRLLGGLFRNPNRFAMIFPLPIMLFVGLTFTPFTSRRRHVKAGLAILFMLVFIADMRLFRPQPIRPTPPVYDFYEAIGAESGERYGDYVLVEVPNAVWSGEMLIGSIDATQLQYYGIIHGKRMVNGFLARIALNEFQYLLVDDPMLSWLGQRRYLEPPEVERQLRERIDDWPIGYIVVHQDIIGRNGPTNQEIIGYFNALNALVCPVWVEHEVVVYRTAWHPDGCPLRTPSEIEPDGYHIDIGSPGDEKFIGWGWHWPETVAGISVRWTGDWNDLVAGSDQWMPGNHPQAEIFVDLPPAGYVMTITAQSLQQDRRLEVLVNDVSMGETTVSAAGLQPVSFELPESILGSGQHIRITLRYGDTELAGDRQLALMISHIDFARLEGR